MTVHVTVDDLADASRAVQPLDAPLLLVDLDAPHSPAGAAAAAVAVHDARAVVLGVSRGVAAPAVLLDVMATTFGAQLLDRRAVVVPDLDAMLDLLTQRVLAHADAALVLSDVLRCSDTSPAAEALLVESLAYSLLLAGPDFARWRAAHPARAVRVSAEPVRLHRDGRSLTVTLTRPERRNAMHAPLREALLDAFAVAASEPGLHVHLSGAGPSFSSGGDLDEFGSAADPVSAHRLRTHRSLARAVSDLARRTTAHLHGPCAGAGVELASFAGRVLAAPGTSLLLPELDLGLIPGAGGTVSLPRRIGRWRTAWMVLAGLPVQLETALAWGLVDGVDT